MIKRLRQAGAIILGQCSPYFLPVWTDDDVVLPGKSNLSEWASYRQASLFFPTANHRWSC